MSKVVLPVVSIKDGPSLANVETSIPEDFDGLVKWLPGGQDQLLGYALSSIIIAAQSFARGKMAAEKEDGTREFSDAQVREEVKTWKPGETRKTISPEERAVKMYADARRMGDKDLMEMIAGKWPHVLGGATKTEAKAEKAKPALVKAKGRKAA